MPASKVALTLKNESPVKLQIVYVGSKGEVPQGNLHPMSSKKIASFVGHKFSVRDNSGNERASVKVTEEMAPETVQYVEVVLTDQEKADLGSGGPNLAKPNGEIHLQFLNTSPVMLDYFFVPTKGEPKKFGTIAPFHEARLTGYVGNRWNFVDRSGKLHSSVEVSPFKDTYTIDCKATLSTAELNEAFKQHSASRLQGIPTYSVDAENETTFANVLGKLNRGGPFGGFTEDPCDAIAAELEKTRDGVMFVDEEFPPVSESIQREGTVIDERYHGSGWTRLAQYVTHRIPVVSKHVDHSIKVTFKNDLSEDVTIQWVDHGGKCPPEHLNTIAAGSKSARKTFAGHVWLLETAGGVRRCFVGTRSTAEEHHLVKVSSLPPFPSVEPHKPTIFGDGASPHDIVQGYVGNCWLCGALSSCAVYPKRIEDCFPSALHRNAQLFIDHGIHVLKMLAIDGRSYYYVLDDNFPIMTERNTSNSADKNSAFFSRPQNGKLWVSLFEKLYAKFRGSYSNLGGGTKSDKTGCDPPSVHAGIMGGKGTVFTWKVSGMDAFNAGGGWSHLLRLVSDPRSTVSVSSRNETAEEEKVSADGLVNFHAYALVDARELPLANGSIVRLLAVRNTWGKTEWNGAWSDDAPEWDEHPEIAEVCDSGRFAQKENNDDGQFWIALEDFVEKFERLTYNDHEPQLLDDESYNMGLLGKVRAQGGPRQDRSMQSRNETRWLSLFHRFDADRNGVLTRDEVNNLLEAYSMDPARALDAFEKRKVWDDDVVTFDEFCVVAAELGIE